MQARLGSSLAARWVRRFAVAGVITTITAATGARRVDAGGVEVTVGGARAVGRGGAMAASAIGFDALRYNPARLALATPWSFAIDTQLHMDDLCFQREDEAGTDYPEVCDDSPPAVIPHLGSQITLGNSLGLGIGLLATPGKPRTSYGDAETGEIEVDGALVPSPSRYANIQTNNKLLFPTIGVGATVIDKVRLGAAFGWGLAQVQTIGFSTGVPGGGEALDSRAALSGVDRFVPRLTLAVDVEPVPGLTLASVTTWTDDIRADADLYLSGRTDGGYSTRIDGVAVTQPLGLETTLGVGYRRPRWDVGLDLAYQGRGRTQEVLVDLPDDAMLPIDATINGVPVYQLPDERSLQRHWKNVWVVRAGGDVALIPDRLWLRAGLSHETSGVEHGYESVDNYGVERTGAHVGVSVDVTPSWQLTGAYARVMQPTTQVAPADARIEQGVGSRPGDLADVHVFVNSGTYEASLHVVAVALSYRGTPQRTR